MRMIREGDITEQGNYYFQRVTFYFIDSTVCLFLMKKYNTVCLGSKNFTMLCRVVDIIYRALRKGGLSV